MSAGNLACPDRVFHYTNAEGLLGILQSRKLWASDSLYLNDLQEIRYAAGLLNAEICGRLAEGTCSPELNEYILSLRTWLEQRIGHDGSSTIYVEDAPLVVSFCDCGDILSMWRSYSGSSGFSIEFDSHILLKSVGVLCKDHDGQPFGLELTRDEYASLWSTNFDLVGEMIPINYDSQCARNDMSLLLDSIVQSFKERRNEIDAGFPEGMFAGLVEYKDPAFSEERETRLIVHRPSCLAASPKLRVARGHLVPYREICFPFSAIRSITVGPSPYRSRSASALRQRLRSGGRGEWAHVEVRESSIPYAP